MKVLCIVLLVVLSFGCAAPKYNYQPKTIDVSDPPIGSINTVAVGDTMLRQGKYTERDAIIVRQPIGAGLYTIFPGQYLKMGHDEDTEYYYPGGHEPGRVHKPALVDPWSSVIIKKTHPEKICVMTAYGSAITTCTSTTTYERVALPSTSSDSFQQTLIYSGKVGNKINIGYREFSSSRARPAFNNDVEYDLSESALIQYKGAKLEVIEATNQHIQFRLLSNFNDAKL